MKQLLLTTIAAVVLVGCGESQQSALAPEAKSKPSTDVAHSIHDAVDNGNIEAVKQHLAAGVDVNVKATGGGWTPLHYATVNDRKEITELLIDEGANVNAKDNDGDTALHIASGKGHKEIAELLIAKGADVSAKDEDIGATPLHLAAQEGRMKVAKLLITNGADVNAKNKYGGTPLHLGGGMGKDKEFVELLIAKGADVNVKDKFGNTPLDFAIRHQRTNIADLLRKHGGKTAEELKAEGK